MPPQPVIYRDLDIKFQAHPVSGRIKMLENNDAITQAFKLLVFTDQYERLCQPDIYTNVRALLFENLSETTSIIVNNYIKNASSNYEKRVKILDLEVLQSNDKQKIALKITYAGINNLNNVTVVLFLDRLR